MQLADIDRLTAALPGVRRTTKQGLAEWRFHGRLVARQLDEAQVVVRAAFDYREQLLRRSPSTFSVPKQFEKHMMVVADLSGEDAAIEDAIEAAWDLQRAAE
ncbi:MAG TPA: hypothetical protein VME70_16465 [Mycobacteriales bacterium]|nr:hypothetical protein [Mycobacteriales bacterium]